MNTRSTNPELTAHDRFFAPILLSPFADDMARRLTRLTIGPLLELTAGTGVLTQAIASAVSANMAIIATDPDPAMVHHASGKPGMARVTWQRADPHALPFPDQAFGIITCQFGIAAMQDRIRVFQEARRVVKKHGRFVFSVLGDIRHNPIADCLQTALGNLFPNHPPKFVALGLHGYTDNTAIDDDLTIAGFTDAIYTVVELPLAAVSAAEIVTGYCLGTKLRTEIEVRAPGNAQPVIEAVTSALESCFGKGPVKATMRAHIISASG